jgi:hypothetical protein
VPRSVDLYREMQFVHLLTPTNSDVRPKN